MMGPMSGAPAARWKPDVCDGRGNDRLETREAGRGIVDLALARSLDLDGDVVGDTFRRGGGLQRRRLPNGVILGGNGDGDDTRLDDGCSFIVDDGLRLV